MFICIQKICVEEDRPYGVHQLSSTVCGNICGGSITCELHIKVQEIGRKLYTTSDKFHVECLLLTFGIYATWWHEAVFGFPRTHFDWFPKKRYKGQSDAVPKLARWVESDHSIKLAMTRSSVHPGSGGCCCSFIWASIMASDEYSSS